jgi:hypothetical protein
MSNMPVDDRPDGILIDLDHPPPFTRVEAGMIPHVACPQHLREHYRARGEAGQPLFKCWHVTRMYEAEAGTSCSDCPRK